MILTSGYRPAGLVPARSLRRDLRESLLSAEQAARSPYKNPFFTFRVSDQREEPCETAEVVEDKVVNMQGEAWLA